MNEADMAMTDVAMSAHTTGPRFGIITSPQQVSYRDVLRVWREADTIPEIEHAWLFDHLMPIRGDRNGPIFEGWTLLSALAAQTERLRLGLLVTSNRFRPPAMLAKIAATVDVVSDGRLDFGIGAGSRPNLPLARREYEAHGLPYHDFTHSVGDLAEACTVIRRLWTEAEPFDFDGTYLHLTGAICNPKPVQQPHPPILIGGRSTATLRVVAEHANLWNIPGGDIDDANTVMRIQHGDGVVRPDFHPFAEWLDIGRIKGMQNQRRQSEIVDPIDLAGDLDLLLVIAMHLDENFHA